MNYKFNDGNLGNLAHNLKVTLFDITSDNQAKLGTIEEAIANCTDSDQEQFLRNLWANYYDSLKTAINSTNSLISAVEDLDSCRAVYANLGKSHVAEQQEEVMQEAMTEEVADIEDVVENVQEVTVSEKEVPDTAIEEAVSVEEVPVATEEVSEDVSEVSVAEEVPVATEEVSENVSEAPIAEEVPVASEEVSENVSEAPVAVANVPVPTEGNSESVSEISVGTVPTPTEGVSEIVPEVASGTVVDISSLDSLESAPVIPMLPLVEEKNVFLKEADGNPILVNTNQATKLRLSRDVQSALIHSMKDSVPTSVEAPVVEAEDDKKKLEEMMNQVTQLYAQGDTEEAENLSNQISELNKKLTLTA